jgi:hypothetical protein
MHFKSPIKFANLNVTGPKNSGRSIPQLVFLGAGMPAGGRND